MPIPSGSGTRWPCLRTATALFVAALALLATDARAEWQRFGTGDGLADNWVWHLLEDHTGDLWFATDNGVSRYDGANWRTFTTADGLASNAVYRVLEDRAGNLWFGTESGVSRYDGETWRTFTSADGLPADAVAPLLQDRAGNLWFTIGEGVCRYDGANWLTFTSADGLACGFVSDAMEDRAGNLWFVSECDVSRFDGTAWRRFDIISTLRSGNPLAIMEDRAGRVWIGMDVGTAVYDGVSWTPHRFRWPDEEVAVYDIVEDRAGVLWFATDFGVVRYDGASWREFGSAEGFLAGGGTRSLCLDRIGNLWCGTSAGACRYDGANWRTYTSSDGLPDNRIQALLEDRAGNLWFGTLQGVTRFDGTGWRTFTTTDGLTSGFAQSAAQDSAGNLWFGTQWYASRFDGSRWTTFGSDSGMASNWVESIVVDRTGNVWFATPSGVTRYDGVRCTTFTIADGLASDYVSTMFLDQEGNIWFGTLLGATRFDGADWRTFTTADGLAGDQVSAIGQDVEGNLWFGTNQGISRFDGTRWTTYTTADGLAGDEVFAILGARDGHLWVGTMNGGVNRFDGERWGRYTSIDGLGHDRVREILQDRTGALWFGTEGGATRHECDTIPPRTVFTPRPPRLSASRMQTLTFAGAFRETRGIAFSSSFDGSPWTDWTPEAFRVLKDLTDGRHTLSVIARDQIGNVESEPVAWAFEVDATAPQPVISSPAAGRVVRDTLRVVGTTADTRFRSFRVETRALDAATWDTLAVSSAPVTEGQLALWATVTVADGDYELRLSVTDSLGLTGTVLVRVIVDNHEPWAEVTAPATIGAASGGHLFTANAELHLYFPPHAFTRDARVTLTALTREAVPNSLDGGGRLLPGYQIDWSGGELTKPATLELSYAAAPPVSGTPALYVSGADSAWRRLGGTVEADARRISAPLEAPGRYALFDEAGVASGVGGLSIVALTPRVFSPGGGFADRQVAISFTLGRSGAVTVRIHNRAGRLIRDVVSGEPMSAGVNLVRWDGADRQGRTVAEGLYLVSIEALGEKQMRTVAVVR